MSRFNRIFIAIFLVVIAGSLAYGGYFVFKKKEVKSFLTQKFPDLLPMGTINLPGKLIAPPQSARAEKLEAEKIIEWTNFYRKENGLQPLTANTRLTAAAQTKTEDMFRNQYFDHVSPSGQTPAELVLNEGYNYKITGENLALGDFKDEKDLVDAWMASPGHRANILNENYTQIGIASGLNKYQDREQTWISVQEFGRPAPNCPKPAGRVSDTINDKKKEYQKLVSAMNPLFEEAKTLADQANAKIEEGNETYKKTQDTSKAEPLWKEGEDLRKQSNDKYNEAKQTEARLKTLYSEINDLVNQYNAQVNSYNECIKQ